MFISKEFSPGPKLGHVGSETRSEGQLLEKPCKLSSRHSFDPVFIKLCQNVCTHLILTKFETGSCRVKNLVARSDLGEKNVARSDLGKKNCIHSKRHSYNAIFVKLCQNVYLK